MSRVVEHLAELTAFRDRDLLDVTLAGALKDLLQPQEIAIYRCVGEAGQQRWLTRARLQRGDVAPSADPLWVEFESLPLLATQPSRHACLLRQETIVPTPAPGRAATACFALSGECEAVGVLEITTALPLDADARRLVCSILRIYRNFQGLLDYSERDSLTGLLNRKTFDASFLRSTAVQAPVSGEFGEAESGRRCGGGGFWLGMIDIDHFKRVNDNHGHLIGDEVLLLLSRLMRGNFRFHDQLYRFGGEEFVVLMRCGSDADAKLALERLRARVQAYPFPQVGCITVSIGFTALRPGDTPAEAFERADKAVYVAKQRGRNQVWHHADLVAEGVLTDEDRSSDVELF